MNKKVKWRSPSNIALIKYWGKYRGQMPANPNLSLTLSECVTETELYLSPVTNGQQEDFTILFNGEEKPSFRPKIARFLSSIRSDLDFLRGHHLHIHTTNTFPHSSGIASSASGMSALALGLLSLSGKYDEESDEFLRQASIWSRLGSGSACRSVYGGMVEWGEFPMITGSSNEYAIAYPGEINDVFKDFRDYILIVETGSKTVSSSAGHGLMKGHPFAERRFVQARENLKDLLSTLPGGDLERFGNIVECEALSLHAMMMTSHPAFILMKPGTLQVIEHIWRFREETAQPLYFTLDAGANVHLLFPANIEQAVNEFVKSDLTPYLKKEQYICDRVGQGPAKLS